MIIQLIDRTPVKINEQEWEVIATDTVRVEKTTITMTVIKKDVKYIAHANVQTTPSYTQQVHQLPSSVLWSGGYMIDAGEKDYQYKLFQKIDLLSYYIWEFCTGESKALDYTVRGKKEIQGALNDVCNKVKYGMPAEQV